MNQEVRLIECPRDAMQGLQTFIPTKQKIAYLNQLLKCGFDTLDAGSFVSPKAIPQLRDTHEVFEHLDRDSKTKILAIVANARGAEEATQHDNVSYIGYPFSVSETFQQRNTGKGIQDSLDVLDNIQRICLSSGKQLVVYLSMGFGNPYGEQWHPDIVVSFTQTLVNEYGITYVVPSDTIGCATPESVNSLFRSLIASFSDTTFSAHLHARPENVVPLVSAAFQAGCRRYDGALKGFGGCPMAKDDLTGNVPSEIMLNWFEKEGIETGVDPSAFSKALTMAQDTFPL
jgi:hydroxymethylglutaryl-CoA lyase